MEEKDLKEKLTPLQYKVTMKGGTEKPFDNEYWDNHEEGIYVDIISNKPLFSSNDKFDSGTGWPSFSKPIKEDAVKKNKDYKMIIPRTEIKSASSNAHLGHVFKDGPKETGLRYCMNSASLKFIPQKDLKKKGYERYSKDFKK